MIFFFFNFKEISVGGGSRALRGYTNLMIGQLADHLRPDDEAFISQGEQSTL